jgi:heme exporter protein CcmD
MGGYARYVWPCFAFTAAVLAWNLWAAQRGFVEARRRALRSLQMAEDDQA